MSSLFFVLPIFIGPVFIYFLGCARKSRANHFSNWFLFFSVLKNTKQKVFSVQETVATAAVVGSSFCVCVYYPNQRARSNKASFPPRKRATCTQTRSELFLFCLRIHRSSGDDDDDDDDGEPKTSRRKKERKEIETMGVKGGACGLPASLFQIFKRRVISVTSSSLHVPRNKENTLG